MFHCTSIFFFFISFSFKLKWTLNWIMARKLFTTWDHLILANRIIYLLFFSTFELFPSLYLILFSSKPFESMPNINNNSSCSFFSPFNKHTFLSLFRSLSSCLFFPSFLFVVIDVLDWRKLNKKRKFHSEYMFGYTIDSKCSHRLLLYHMLVILLLLGICHFCRRNTNFFFSLTLCPDPLKIF